MRQLRLVEHYASVQCEGARTGQVTQFVRFAGCNMRCPLWPCDTQHAIDPKIWVHNSYKQTPEELLEACKAKPGKNICLTGGEPFMQDHEQLRQFCDLLAIEGYMVEAFTNGSYIYPDWALAQIHFTMDWKLPGSGEHETEKENRLINARALKFTDDIKFVVADKKDLDWALETWKMLTHAVPAVKCEFYVGSAWKHITDEDIVNFVLECDLPWKLNVQVHKYIWDPEKQGV